MKQIVLAEGEDTILLILPIFKIFKPFQLRTVQILIYEHIDDTIRNLILYWEILWNKFNIGQSGKIFKVFSNSTATKISM